jgi:D-glycero-D-manno-heptose 1,7-bisphosphate phosphatase
MSQTKLIILDRDGVINHDSDHYIKHPDEWSPIEGSAQAIADLAKQGFKIAVATNQSGLSRGLFDLTTLKAIHQKMFNYLAEHGARIDQLEYCPDHPDNPGPNRKPAPGMALALLAHFNAIPAETWFVGDTMSDVMCAINSGCKPALVKTGKGMKTLANSEIEALNVPVFEDLADFVRHLG